MNSLIDTFHIDWKLLLAQIINFAIVFAILYFLAIKPLVKVMQERSKKIEKSVNDAKEIEEKLIISENEYAQKMAEAKKEANLIIEKAALHAEEKRQDLLKKAKEEIGQIINEEKEKMQLEKAKTLREIKSEVSDLIIASIEKILEKKFDNKENREMIIKIVKKK